ncbi:MAG: phosphodiester glycosidase family protein [Actinomycetia bacterium]|nr:phosphodiester glycosidase family protein [Actinomycetes bacterium]
MELSTPTAVRTAALLGASALVATLAVAVTPADQADAARPCRIDTTTSLDSAQRFAGGGVLRRYTASAKGVVKGGYDQTAKVIMTSYPSGAYPSLINDKVGERQVIGDMAKNQQPQALGAINGDFFIFPDIRYATDIEMARGPMIRDGRVIRGTTKRQRVVGIDMNKQPFGGMVAVRGAVTFDVPAGTGVTAQSVPLTSMNWHSIIGGGVNVYTTEWSPALRADGKAVVPRPAGAVEWVLNGRNKIQSIRSSTKNQRQLGDPVKAGTRVLAFSDNSALATVGVPSGTKVRVNIKQSTDTGVKLFTAVGRGLPLVEGGVAAPLGCNAYDLSKAARPRTFVGWNSNGVWRSFTVPGRGFDGVGLRVGGFGLANAANIAKKLGMANAYELDGGGSTTLWTRSTAGKWTRRDLYGVDTSVCTCERPMTNGLSFLAGP